MDFEGPFAGDGRRSFENVEGRSPEAGVDPRRADPDDRVSGEVGPRVVANFDSRRVVIVHPPDVGVERQFPGLERLGRLLHVAPNVGRQCSNFRSRFRSFAVGHGRPLVVVSVVESSAGVILAELKKCLKPEFLINAFDVRVNGNGIVEAVVLDALVPNP